MPSEGHFRFNLSQDHADLLLALNARGAKYLVVGGYAFGAYVQPRATKHLDIFILSERENAVAVFRALADFGAPLEDLSPRTSMMEKATSRWANPAAGRRPANYRRSYL
jgi:hypothetical protein